jgi:two-component sensor histidine kinase
MAASQLSELNDKIKEALEQMQANTTAMEEKQQEMDKERETVDLRFKDLTDKLGSVVTMVKRTSEGQVRLQASREGQHAQLNQLSELFQEWITHQKEQGDQSVRSGSPQRKKRIVPS